MSDAHDSVRGPDEAAVRTLVAAYRVRFGTGETPHVFFSPGRVNLMGAHLDYNGGPVMPTAIDRGTFLALGRRTDGRLRLASTLSEHEVELELTDLPDERAGRWTDYPLGVVRALVAGAREAGTGAEITGIDCLYGGNLPVGAGLSSSASICVGTAHALDTVWGLGLDEHAKIRAALSAEREFVGVQCGIMDPFAVMLTRPGHLLWIDCKDESVQHVPLDTGRAAICVADTGVRRELARGAFNERVSQCAEAYRALAPFAPGATCLRDVTPEVLEAHASELDPVLAKRARHVVTEVRRAEAAREALERGDLAGFGGAMSAAHESLRDLFEVSIEELDGLVAAALEWDGVFGTRLTGAGFGGCIVVLLDTGACEGFAEHLGERYEARFGRRPTVELFHGTSGPREL